MCKYCERVTDDDVDITYLDENSLNLCNGIVKYDTSIYLTVDRNKVPSMAIVNCFWVNGSGPYDETVKYIPIRCCPCCGRDLISARHKYDYE